MLYLAISACVVALSFVVTAIAFSLRGRDASPSSVAAAHSAVAMAAARSLGRVLAKVPGWVVALREFARSKPVEQRFTGSSVEVAIIEQRTREEILRMARARGVSIKPPGKERLERMIHSAARRAREVSGEEPPRLASVISELAILVELEIGDGADGKKS